MAWERIVIEFGNDFLDGPSVEQASAEALNIVRLGVSHNVPSGQTDFNVVGQSVPMTVRFRRQLLAADPSSQTPIEATAGGKIDEEWTSG